MRLRDFYTKLVATYGHDKLHLGQFVNPLLHPNLGTQFIYYTGHPHAPLVKEADSLMHPEPLAGSFYDLEVQGIIPQSDINAFRVVVKMPDATLQDTAPILTEMDGAEMKGLASEFGIKWYYAKLTEYPREYIELPTFDDCVKHGTALAKDSL